MKALLTKNYIYISPFVGFRKYYNKHLEFKKWVKENQGKWVDIDTKYLFNNQYNTVDGYRIYDTWIDRIKGDVREKSFFKKHPNGKDKIKDVDFKDHRKNERFISCSDVNRNYYRVSRMHNLEFIIADNEIYTVGIGYTPIKESGLSDNEISIIKYCADRIKEM